MTGGQPQFVGLRSSRARPALVPPGPRTLMADSVPVPRVDDHAQSRPAHEQRAFNNMMQVRQEEIWPGEIMADSRNTSVDPKRQTVTSASAARQLSGRRTVCRKLGITQLCLLRHAVTLAGIQNEIAFCKKVYESTNAI